MNKRVSILTAAILVAIGSQAFGADLLEVYNQAKQSDPQMAAATAAHGAALEAKPQAWSALKPHLTASGSKSHVESDVLKPNIGMFKYDQTNYQISLLQPIYHHDYWVQLGQANSRVAQADAQYTSAEQLLIVRAATAYFNRLSAEDSLRFAQAEKTAIEQQLHQTQQRFNVGLTAITDVREAQASYDLAVSREIAAQNQLETAREQLRELTGEDYPQLSTLGDVPLVTPEPMDVEQWVKTALDQNPQLLASEAQSEVARKEISRRRAGGFPTVDLTASYGHTELPAFARETNDAIIGVQVNWPFYQGGYVSSRTREAEYLYDQSKAGLEQQRRATVRQTRDAYLGIQAGISQVQALKEALISAETALEATQVGYEVGTRTNVDVLNAQQQLYAAQRDYASARYNYVVATLQLKQAAGILTEDDVQKINAWLQAPVPPSAPETAAPAGATPPAAQTPPGAQPPVEQTQPPIAPAQPLPPPEQTPAVPEKSPTPKKRRK